MRYYAATCKDFPCGHIFDSVTSACEFAKQEAEEDHEVTIDDFAIEALERRGEDYVRIELTETEETELRNFGVAGHLVDAPEHERETRDASMPEPTDRSSVVGSMPTVSLSTSPASARAADRVLAVTPASRAIEGGARAAEAAQRLDRLKFQRGKRTNTNMGESKGRNGRIDETANVHPSAKVADDVEILAGTVIEENATVEPGCQLGRYVKVGAGAHIGKGTKLDIGCRIGENAQVGASCELYDGACVGKGAKLGEKVVIRSEARNGVDTYVGDGGEVGANTKISYGCEIEADTKVGSDCEIGPQTRVEKHATVPNGTKLAAGITVRAAGAEREAGQKPIQPGGDPGVATPPGRPGGNTTRNDAAQGRGHAR